MSYRATKSGLAAETQRKTDGKYDTEEASRCLQWMKTVANIDEIDVSKTERLALWEMLKDGMVLCKLVDTLIPGKIKWTDKTFQVPKIEGMKVMRERERISLFNKAVQDYGVEDTYTFPTESLHEKTDLAQVLICIRALGVEAQARGVGPADYWPKKSERNSRVWSSEQLKAGQNVVSLQMGTNKGASQAGMNMGKQRMIID